MATTGVPNQKYQGTDAPDLVSGAYAGHTHDVVENVWSPTVKSAMCNADTKTVTITDVRSTLIALKSGLFRPHGFFEFIASIPVCDRLWFEFVLNDSALYNYLTTNHPNNVAMFPAALCNSGTTMAFSASQSSGYCEVSTDTSQNVLVYAYLGPVPKAMTDPLISF